jgi:hypothetical protein
MNVLVRMDTTAIHQFQNERCKGQLLIRRHLKSFMALGLLVFFAANTLFVKAQTTMSGEEQTVIDTMNTFFKALETENQSELNSVVAPDFYIFDNGAKFDRNSIVDFIRHVHASGKQVDWNITDPDIHVFGQIAWIAYVNKGRISSGGTSSDQSWLESAFLEKKSGKWKVDFMQSTRIPQVTNAQK